MGLNNSDIDKIKLPDNFDEIIKNTVDKTYKQKNKKGKRGKKVAIAAGLAVAVSSGFMIANPEYVEAAIQKFREVFKTRSYNVVLENGNEVTKGTHEINHLGVNIKLDVDVTTPGVIEIKHRVDSSNIKLEDWKLTEDNIDLNKLSYVQSDVFSNEYQEEVYKKIYEGKDITKELEYIKKNSTEKDYFIQEVEWAKKSYDWGVSDEDFWAKNVNTRIGYTINGEDLSYSYRGEKFEESYYEGTTIIPIPEELVGKKELTLEVKIDDMNLYGGYAIKIPEKTSNIKLRATKEESAIKYILLEDKYRVEGLRDTDLYELIIYPSGMVDLLTDSGSHKGKDYKITKFIIENEDGTRIGETGSSGKTEDDFGSRGKIEGKEGLYRREYKGEVTGNTVKLIPVVTHNTNKNIVVDKDEPILEEIEPIIVKVK
ncbi:MAG: hypothetical protein ACRC6T_00055 [Sarcina sp.]